MVLGGGDKRRGWEDVLGGGPSCDELEGTTGATARGGDERRPQGRGDGGVVATGVGSREDADAPLIVNNRGQLLEGEYEATWTREFNFPWREAGPQNSFGDRWIRTSTSSQVVNKELFLQARGTGDKGRRRGMLAPLSLSAIPALTAPTPR